MYLNYFVDTCTASITNVTFPMQGSSKEKAKKATSCNTETSIVVATPSQMVFPHNEAVVNATHKKRKRKSSSSSSGAKKSKGAATTTTSSSGPNSVPSRYVYQLFN